MNSDLEQDLKNAFAPTEGAEQRVVRAALEPRTVGRPRWVWATASGLAVVAIVAVVAYRPSAPVEMPSGAYRIVNEGSVVTVVSASGDSRLIAARARLTEPGGGIILNLGGNP